jgi:hypothetical protein
MVCHKEARCDGGKWMKLGQTESNSGLVAALLNPRVVLP